MIRIKSEWLGTQYAYHMPTGSQPRVDLALWFASAIGPNFSPREWTPDHLCDILKWPPLRKLLLKFETHPKIGIISLFLKFPKIVWGFWNFLFQLKEVGTSKQRKKKKGSPHDVGQQIHCPPLADKFLCQSHCTALTSEISEWTFLCRIYDSFVYILDGN